MKNSKLGEKIGNILATRKTIKTILPSRSSEDELDEMDSEEIVQQTITDAIKPNIIKERPYHLKMNKKYNRVRTIKGFPKEVDVGFFNELLKSDADINLSIRINPIHRRSAQKRTEKMINRMQVEIEEQREKGKEPVTLVNKKEEMAELKKELDQGSEELFETSMNVNIKARDLEELDKQEEKVDSILRSTNLISKVPGFDMIPAYQTTLPSNKNKLQNNRYMNTSALVGLFPFTSTYTEIEEKGVPMGINQETEALVVKDIYEQVNPNWFIVGTSGAGKSYLAKLIFSQYAFQGAETYIIDPHGEYPGLVEELGGQNLELSPKGGNMINPLDLMGHSYDDKMLSLNDFYNLILDGMTGPQESKMMKATKLAYREKGIFRDDPDTWNKEPPILEDVLEKLEMLKDKEQDSNQISAYNAAIDKLYKYTEGTFRFLNTQTSIDTEAQIVNFDIHKLPRQVYGEMMLLIVDYLWSQMLEDDDKRKQVVVDEAWQLLSAMEGGDSFLKKVVKSSRKFNLSLGMLVQNIEDLLNNKEAGDAIIANTATKILLKQDEAVLGDLTNELGLNDKQTRILRTSGQGEGLLITQGTDKEQKIPIEVMASEGVHDLITTDPEDKKQIKERKKNVRGKENISSNMEEAPDPSERVEKTKEEEKKEEIDKVAPELVSDDFPEKDNYINKNLTKEERQMLEDDPNWKISNQPLFKGGIGKKTWVEVKEDNTSADHEKLVKRYRDYIDNHLPRNRDVRDTKDDADIEFRTPKGKLIGVEVETGINKENNYDNRLEEKVSRNNTKYDEWFFVVTKKDLLEGYGEFGESIKRTDFKEKIRNLIEEED